MFSVNIHKENVLQSQSELSDFIDGMSGVINDGAAGVRQSVQMAGRLHTLPLRAAALRVAAVHIHCANPLVLIGAKLVRGEGQPRNV